MAATSSMLPLGTPAPDFSLADAHGTVAARDDFSTTPALLVMFLSNHCPYVQHVREELADLVRGYQGRGLVAVGICSNDAQTHPDDRPERMAQDAEKYGFPEPQQPSSGCSIKWKPGNEPEYA